MHNMHSGFSFASFDFGRKSLYNDHSLQKGGICLKKTFYALCTLLVLCLLCTGCAKWWKLFPTDIPEVSVDESSSEMSEESTPSIFFTLGLTPALEGDIISVPVSYSGDYPLVNTDIRLTYDSSCLELLKQYDADTDSYSWISPGDFDGVLKGHKTQDGILDTMLATGDEGQFSSTLFYANFRVLKDTDIRSAIKLTIATCGLGTESNDLDALANNWVSTNTVLEESESSVDES